MFKEPEQRFARTCWEDEINDEQQGPESVKEPQDPTSAADEQHFYMRKQARRSAGAAEEKPGQGEDHGLTAEGFGEKSSKSAKLAFPSGSPDNKGLRTRQRKARTRNP
jgi:hypothetical protein